MSHINYGVDVLMNQNGDLVFSANGDMATTKDYEQLNPDDYDFDGQYNVHISLLNRLMTPRGDYQFDPDFGAGIVEDISSTDLGVIEKVRERVETALLLDSRVEAVKSVRVTKDQNYLNVEARITLVGANDVSTYVFPEIYLSQ